MRIVKPLDHVKNNPIMYLGSDTPNKIELMQKLIGDALLLDATICCVKIVDLWCLVASDTDWLKHPDHNIRDLFNKIIAFPEAGINSMRSEILLHAFADAVVTMTPNSRTVISGEIGDNDSVWNLPLNVSNWNRMVAFQLR